MRILYVFPHPDDESFGPARAGRVCQVVENSERVIIRPLIAIYRSLRLFRALHLLPPVDLSHLHLTAAQQAEEQQ